MSSQRTFGIGDSGDDVSRWQQFLAGQGFKIAVDGKFGPATLAATRQVQRRMGLKPDGRVGQKTAGGQAQTEAMPIPRVRPDQPPAQSMPTQVFGAGQTGQPAPQPYTSSGPEADLTAMHTAASNNAWDQQMANALMGQYYDAQKASAAASAPPAPYRPAFAGDASGMTQTPQGALQTTGMMPNFDWAGPSATQQAVDLGGGAAAQVAPVPTAVNPLQRDAYIRMLLNGVGQ